ncbi:isocitrate/isopropylmalate family dehydrogenase [Sphaerisporangium sp. NPDC051017]|uniref:isocitrate/isopropylmalate family dehydrogenase n=1 Tax=Sphaerisporangium sp. NPDC051017 TaxID=3154636 RepID=UPI00341C3454
MSYTIAVIEGDGIGPELVRAATRVMDAAAAATGVELAYESVRAGADRFRETGSAVTPADMNRLREADGILKGPVGLPDVRHPDGAAVTGLLPREDGGPGAAGVRHSDATGAEHEVRAGAVVLAAGGFEADPERRERHLGAGWSRAIVRGTPANTGEVLDMALAVGVAPYGDWGSCHSVAWDAGAPPGGGDRELTNQYTRQSYPIGIVVNREGRRFVDEGADFRNYTYARYGAEILRQPGGVAFQIFDAATRPLLRTEEYDSRPITGAEAASLPELARALGVDPEGLVTTVSEFNAAIDTVRPFDPAVKDGRASRTDPPKSNWAVALETPPYYGYAVSCGITFTFGGLRIDDSGRALDRAGGPVPGLYAAGELVGGLFSGNYPGGTGLTAGAVFGRAAGATAAKEA